MVKNSPQWSVNAKKENDTYLTLILGHRGTDSTKVKKIRAKWFKFSPA
jgi:hypothetical protein